MGKKGARVESRVPSHVILLCLMQKPIINRTQRNTHLFTARDEGTHSMRTGLLLVGLLYCITPSVVDCHEFSIFSGKEIGPSSSGGGGQQHAAPAPRATSGHTYSKPSPRGPLLKSAPLCSGID